MTTALAPVTASRSVAVSSVGSPERQLVDTLGDRLSHLARQGAKRLYTDQMAQEGHDVEVVAMAIVHALLQEKDVAAIFAPDR